VQKFVLRRAMLKGIVWRVARSEEWGAARTASRKEENKRGVSCIVVVCMGRRREGSQMDGC
jgi:hypothetical protein